MNALEIANELDKSRQEPYTSEHLVGQAATMLRQLQAELTEAGGMIGVLQEKTCQQQAEIEALKPYKQKIEEMERRYDEHFKKALEK
jgi:hypothetical protein